MLRWYKACLASRPLLTQSATTAVLFATGDVVAQQLVERRLAKKDDATTSADGKGSASNDGNNDNNNGVHDFARTARMALYGGAVFGPAAATWYGLLQRHVNLATPRRTMLARVAADQGLFAPVFIGVFLGSMAVLEGGNPRDKLAKNYRSALTANYALWPAVQMVNFSVVPLEHRVLFVNVVSLGWNAYLSYLNSGK
ncbi:integral membrane protein mpv17 pmp22 family [Niveomyces insectorum RCEF 264]|uniref:Integral membrane protein mpv17 pmp22 family n=1 Tax=Niveomyces insectorum RCEF 264 TaxID=1081102 RepID=A0A167VLK6_9HYPO|nr:integral membrane protein mpv17 pmp22 family [Niveomyces insectorum RCEF 264]